MSKQSTKTYPTFWNLELHVADGQLIVRQTVSLWELDQHSMPIRIDQQQWNLAFRKIGPGNITIHRDHIEFDNAGLECRTMSLIDMDAQFIKAARNHQQNLPITKSLTAAKSTPYGKENVSLEATISLPLTTNSKSSFPLSAAYTTGQSFASGSAPTAFDNFQPIFYLEQEKGFVMAAEVNQGNQRHILWAIDPSKNTTVSKEVPSAHLTAITPPFALEEKHTIRIHQDGDLQNNTRGNYFEFWVDAIPLGIMSLQQPEFEFLRIPSKFFIGCWPATPDNPAGLFMTGKLWRLYFDPNNTCIGCPA